MLLPGMHIWCSAMNSDMIMQSVWIFLYNLITINNNDENSMKNECRDIIQQNNGIILIEQMTH